MAIETNVDFPDPVRPITAMKMSSVLEMVLGHGKCDGRSCDIRPTLRLPSFAPPPLQGDD